MKAESVCICFIDDCLDCDIPLAELTFSSKSRSDQISNEERRLRNDFSDYDKPEFFYRGEMYTAKEPN